MSNHSKTQTDAPLLPKWAWWLALTYFLLLLLNYAAIFPLRYHEIQARGLPEFLVIIQLGSDYFLIVLLAIMSIFLMMRLPYDRQVTLIAVTLLCGYPSASGLSALSRNLNLFYRIVSDSQIFLASSFTILLVLSFPDGHIIHKRFLRLVVLMFAWDCLRYCFFFLLALPEYQQWRPLALVLNVLIGLPAFASMINRYRHHANPIQRQQFKWFFITGFTFATTVASVILVRGFINLYGDPNILALGNVAVSLMLTISASLGVLSLGFAILRWGLWDVDLTLNRSMVTGITVLLLLLIFGTVFFGGQAILKAVLGEDRGEIAAGLAALLVGLSFNEIRHRVRNFVDRRVYGLRFDLNQLARSQHFAEIKQAGALTGKVLGGYELMDVLGRGGMGEVYKGFANGNVAAVKILQDSQNQRRFEREAAISIEHPNIVKTYGYGEADGISYLALEYIEGISLKTFLQERGKIPFSDVLPLLPKIADAIDTAHRQGYVHRDIKPANIMLRPGNEPVLMDFGLVKVSGQGTSLTGSGAVGTIDYMSPEQIRDSRQVDHRADIYALAVVLYEVLAGELPFRGTAGQVLFAHLQQPPPALDSVPEHISLAIQRGLAKDPQERFQSAVDFVKALT